MKALLTTTQFTLAPGEVASLSIHAAQRLHVEDAAGTDLWLTREKDSEDYWLRCGSSLQLASGGQVVVSVDPRAGRAVRLALVAEARRPAATLADVAHALFRVVRRLVRGTEWTPAKDDPKTA